MDLIRLMRFGRLEARSNSKEERIMDKLKYLLTEHIESGHGSSEKNHTFDTIDEAYQYIKESRNLLEFFKLYEVKQIILE